MYQQLVLICLKLAYIFSIICHKQFYPQQQLKQQQFKQRGLHMHLLQR